MVVNFDARKMPSDLNQPSPARFTIAAHDGAACALDINPHIRGCLATAGTDKMVKIWNVQGDESGGKRQVSLVAGRDLGLVRAFHHTCVFSGYSSDTGRGVLGCLVAGRPVDARGSGFQGKTTDLGCRRQFWCAQGFWTETCRCRARVKREKEWRRHRCCRRRG
jgi:hypothetical protein